MSVLFEGTCNGRAVDIDVGGDNNGKPRVRWSMEVVGGPHAGKRAAYSGKLDAENIKWTKRDMKTVGWKGVDVRTFADDVAKANLVVPFDAEIATNTNDRTGKTSTWTAARLTGSLPLTKLSDDKVADVNRWFAEAEDVNANGKAEEDIPF